MADSIGDTFAAKRQQAEAENKERITLGRKQVHSPEEAARFAQLQGSVTERARTLETSKGVEFGQDILGEEGLGRLGTDEDIKGVLDRFKGISETGLSGAESVAKREQALQGIGQATQTSSRALLAAQAKAGVRGGTAGAQLTNIELGGQRQRANVERDLFLESEGIKRAGLKDFADAIGQVKTFDLGQAAREKDILISSGLGFAGLGSAERSAANQAEQAKQAAIASSQSSCFGPDTLIKMVNGFYKYIEDIELGDITSKGEVYGVSKHIILESELINYKGISVTKEHPVYENGKWILPVTSRLAKGSKSESGFRVYVYDLWTVGQRLEIKDKEGKDVMFTDYLGMNVNSEEDINKLNSQEVDYEVVVKISAGKI